MKQELMEKLSPIVESFVDKVLSSFGDIEKIRHELNQKESLYQDLIAQKEKELSDIRIQKAVDREAYDKKITDMECSKNEHILKAKTYQDLLDELSTKRKEIEDDLARSKIELVRAKDIRIQADKTKEDAERLRKSYELKLESLQRDFNKNESDKKANESERVKLTARENDIFKNENKQNQKEQELNDMALKLRADRKEIDRLIKRYNLENSLKEK